MGRQGLGDDDGIGVFGEGCLLLLFSFFVLFLEHTLESIDSTLISQV